MYWAVLTNVPAGIVMVNVEAVPFVIAMLDVPVLSNPVMVDGAATATPSTVAVCIVTVPDPVFWTVKTAVWSSVIETLVMDACSELPMKPMVNAPIHAATTTLTATVTAMSMMVAITGLSALLLFLNFLKFILFIYPPLGYLI